MFGRARYPWRRWGTGAWLWLVTAGVACGNGPGEPEEQPPDAPSQLSVVATSRSSVRLLWQDNADNERGYRVYRGLSVGDATTLIESVGRDCEECHDTGLDSSTTYFYRVCAFNDAGTSACAAGSVDMSVPAPAIVLGATSLTFTSGAGAASPPPQTVEITNGGGGTLTGLAAAIAGTPDWLDASLSATTAPAMLTVGPVTTGLAAGTYTATIAVSSPVASNTPQTIGVTLTVTPPGPVIVLSPTGLSFNAEFGGSNPPAQSVAVTNGGSGTLGGLTRSFPHGTPTWLSADLSGPTAPATLTVQPSLWCFLNPCAPGIYRDTVLVSSAQATNSPQWVAVVFTITAPSQITAYASADNEMAYATLFPGFAYTTYQSSQNGVGCDWSYWAGGYDFICLASALQFNVNALLAGRTVEHATLRLHVYGLRGDFSFTPFMRLRAFAGAWSPASITWMNMPVTHLDGEVILPAPSAAGVPVDIDVTPIVQRWASGTWVNYGFQLYPVIPNPPGYTSLEATHFQSLEFYYAATERPQLIVTFQ
jgi:hypothetical protein